MVKMVDVRGNLIDIQMTAKTFAEADLFRISERGKSFELACGLFKSFIKNANLPKDKYHMKTVDVDNALVYFRESNIKEDDDVLCYGIAMQFNLVKEDKINEQVCDVKFLEGKSKDFEKVHTIYDMKYRLAYASEANITAFRKREQYDEGLIAMFEEMATSLDIANKDNASYIKNLYLALDKIATKTGIVYDTFQKVKELPFVEKCRYEGKSIFCKTGKENLRINIIGYDMFEINSYYLKSYDDLQRALKTISEGYAFMPLNYMMMNCELMNYSKSKNIMDLIDVRKLDVFKTESVDKTHENDIDYEQRA